MNLLQLEDVVKGLPDDRLFQEAQSPSGELPQFLTISEIRRRSDMRERFQAQEQQPQGTVADQVLQQGLASMQGQGPPQGQMQGYAGGGQVQPRWWERMLPMAHPNMIMRDMQPQQESNLLHHTGKPFPRLEASGNIRMQIADIQSNGMTPDLDENGQPIISWEDGEPRVVVNGQPYDYAGGGIVSFQSGGRVSSPGLDFLRRNPIFGGFVEPIVGMYGEATDPYQSANIGPEVNQGIASIPQSEFVGPPEPSGPDPLGGGQNVQGGSPIQEQAMDWSAMLAPPQMPDRDPIEYPSGAAQREGLAALGADSRDMYERMAEEQRGSEIDVSDLIEGGKKDAWASAMVQIGAGIARNDLAGGLEQAGETGHDAAKQARKMELWSRIQKAENDAKARELLAKGEISEREYQKAVLESERSEDLGRTEFDFKQREADRLDLYRQGQAHVNSLQAQLAKMEILEKLSSMAATGESEVPEPPEGQTMYEQMQVATGLGNSLKNALGQAVDVLIPGQGLPDYAKDVVKARADMRANLERLYGALSDTRAWKEREWIRDKYDIDPKWSLGDDTGIARLEGLSNALKTMLRQEEMDAQNPNLEKKEREKASHNARVIRNFIPIIGAPDSSAEDFLNQ